MSLLQDLEKANGVSSIPAQSTKAPSGGFLSQLHSVNQGGPSPEEATRTFNIQSSSIAASKQAAALSSPMGILKQTAREIIPRAKQVAGDIIGGAINGVKDAFTSAPEQSINPVVGIKAGVNSLSDSISQAGDSVSNTWDVYHNEHASALDKGIATGETGMKLVGAIFSPVTAALSAAQTLPVVGHVATAINGFFGALGGAGGALGTDTIDGLPVSEETKAKLKPLAGEIGALVAQIGAGKIGGDAYKKFTGKVNEVTKTLAADPAVKGEAVAPKTEAALVASPEVAKPKTQVEQLSNLTKNSIENKPVGVKEKSVQYFKDHPDQITVDPIKIREVDGALTVEDGRHRLQAAKDVGISDLQVEDVTPEYTGQSSKMLEQINKKVDALATTQAATPLAEPQQIGIEQKPSGVGKSIEANAIEQKLTEGFGGTAGYDPITIAEQSNLTSHLINNNLDLAKRMLSGDHPLPSNIHGTSLIVGLEDYAMKNGDAALLRDIANSPLTSETSYHAQSMRILQERAGDSAAKILEDVKKAKKEAVEKKSGTTIEKAKNDTVKDIKEEIKKSAPKKQDWASFVEEIRCNY